MHWCRRCSHARVSFESQKLNSHCIMDETAPKPAYLADFPDLSPHQRIVYPPQTCCLNVSLHRKAAFDPLRGNAPLLQSVMQLSKQMAMRPVSCHTRHGSPGLAKHTQRLQARKCDSSKVSRALHLLGCCIQIDSCMAQCRLHSFRGVVIASASVQSRVPAELEKIIGGFQMVDVLVVVAFSTA